MRALLFVGILIATLVKVYATSYLFTLEQKVAACTAILRVSVTEAAPPRGKDPLQAAVCQGKVLQILKGPADMKKVEFRFYPYVGSARDKVLEMIGKDYFVFLHEPPSPRAPRNQLWVFEGPGGIRPIAAKYTEERIVDYRIITETYSHRNYVARIIALDANLRGKAVKEKR